MSIARSQRLLSSECESVIDEFRDPAGQPLRMRLATFGVGLREYLSWIQFRDGGEPPCGNGRTLLYTSPGSRVVQSGAFAIAGWFGIFGWRSYDPNAQTKVAPTPATQGGNPYRQE